MHNGAIRDIGPEIVRPQPDRIKSPKKYAIEKPDFRNEFNESLTRLGDLKFSGHALDRLADRGVFLSGDKRERLLKAVDAAQIKGARDSLVLLDELAFVVSVKNRTVITACEMSNLKQGVFTQIDSAVLG
jgi:flagellar operon protein